MNRPGSIRASGLRPLLASLWHTLHTDTALRNSLFLITSTGVMALSGFSFWFVGARLYTTSQLGLSSTLMATATALAFFALLGLDNVLIRYLPGSRTPNRIINTSIVATTLASVVLSIIFLCLLPLISPPLYQVLANPLHQLFFVTAMIFVSANTLTDNIFISFRSAKYVLYANSGQSLAKIVLPILLVTYGAFGLFMAFALAITVATCLSLAFLARYFNYRFRPVADITTLRQVRKFSAGVYTSNIMGMLPFMILPIIITDTAGSDQAAFYNLAMAIAAMLYIVPRSTANALFAEIAKNPGSFAGQTYRISRQTAAITIPSGIILLILSHPLLTLFGSSYAHGATAALQVMVLSAPALGINVIIQTVLKVHHRLVSLSLVQITGTILMVALCWPLAARYGAAGGTWAWFIGQTVMALLSLIAINPLTNKPLPGAQT